MRFFPVLLSFTTVLFHFGYQVLAPRITELLPEAAEEGAGALKEYSLFPSSGPSVVNEAGSSHGAIGDSRWQQGLPYGGGASHDYPYSGHGGYQHDPYRQYGGNLAFHRHQGHQLGSYQAQVAHGLEGLSLSSSSGPSVVNEAGSSHGAIGDSPWQQGSPYGGHGYLGGASHDYQYSGQRGYQHDPYPQYGGEQADHREQGSQRGSYQDAPRATFADVLRKANQRGQGAKPAKQRATPRANAVDGRGKQPVQAHQDRAAYGSQSYPLQSHDPTVAASQGGMRHMSGPRALNPPNAPLDGPQLALTRGWIVQLLKLRIPNTEVGEVMPSMQAYRADPFNLPKKDSEKLLRFLHDKLIQQHARKWVELYRGLAEKGGVPTLATIEHPLALTNQVIGDAMLPKNDKKSIFHSALAVHASYQLRVKIEENLVKINQLDEIRSRFTKDANRVLLDSWPKKQGHANAASLAVQFLNAFDESKEGYNMFSAEELVRLGDTTRKRRIELEAKGSK